MFSSDRQDPTGTPSGDNRLPNGPFYLLIGGALAFLTIPRMAQPGMFLDGVTYAVIARNLAQGIGTFWFPSYTATVYPRFHEQPPLGLALESAAFAVFGDHLAVERAYSLVLAIVIALLIAALWRRTVAERSYDWLPLIFWLLPASVTWAVVNNMLETTQALFTTASLLTFVVSVQAARGRYVLASLAGACVIAAVLVKGPTGLFPLAAPVLLALLMRAYRAAAIRNGVIMIATVLVAGGAAYLWQDARLSLSAYWHQQLFAALSGARGAGRWASLLRHLAGGILLRMGALLMVAAVWHVLRRRASDERYNPPTAWTWFFALLALAGSLPVAFSARVAGHYLIPSVPVYAIAAAGAALPFVRTQLDAARQNRKIPAAIGLIGLVLLAASAVLPLAGRPLEVRDRQWIAEYRALSPRLPRGAVLGTCEAARSEWGLHAYMQRFFQISLDPDDSSRPQFLKLIDRPCDSPVGCRVIAEATKLALLDCRPGS